MSFYFSIKRRKHSLRGACRSKIEDFGLSGFMAYFVATEKARLTQQIARTCVPWLCVKQFQKI
jgi:hypothetical protein